MHPLASRAQRLIPKTWAQLVPRGWVEIGILLLTFTLWPLSWAWLPASLLWVGFLLHSALARPQRLAARLLVFACTPMIIVAALSFSWGLATSATGTATWRVSGSPHFDDDFQRLQHARAPLNPHRAYRVPIVSSGCLVDGSEVFHQAPNNFAVMLWTTQFGYADDAYLGPYPDAEQARRLLRENGRKVALDMMESPIAVAKASLEDSLRAELEAAWGLPPGGKDVLVSTPGDEALLMAPSGDFVMNPRIVLVDLRHQEIVATYRWSGP